MLEKPEHPLEREILDRQLRDKATRIRRNEGENQPQNVTLAPNRRRPRALLCGQVIDEEGVHQRAECGAHYGCFSVTTGEGSAWKRRLTSAKRPRGMVKYTPS